jgi:glycosyltransferase involved in cell wall biosynthesis
MKVVQINQVCGVGSTGRITVDLSNVMTENGIENYIFYGLGQSGYPLARKFGSLLNIRLHQVGTRFWGYHGFYSVFATKELINKLDKINPDVIHLHLAHGFYINIKILFEYFKKTNAKILWTLHDCWSFTGHCAHFSYVKCEQWKTECGKCKNLKSYPVSHIFDRSKNQFIKKKEIFTGVKNLEIITPCIWLKDMVEQSFLKEYPVKVINNGVDLNNFQPAESDLRRKLNLDGKFIILGISFSLKSTKGGKYLVMLAEKLEINKEFHIVVLGLKTDGKLPPNITVLPKTNSIKELAEIYSMADVFVNPTLEDTFPTVNLEALACGVPVITFDTGGSAEAIDENTGIKVRQKDIAGLLDAVNTVKANGKGFYSENCRKRAEKRYSNRDRYLEYIKEYKA